MQFLTYTATAQVRDWEYRPYRIQAIVALDVPGGLQEQLTTQLPVYLQYRATAAIGPLWQFEAQVATGVLRQQMLAESPALFQGPPAELPADRDKRILITVRSSPAGFTLVGREYDRYVDRWSTPLRRECRQEYLLAEQIFALVCETFAPLAHYEVDPTDAKRVVLTPQGASIARFGSAGPWTKPGDVFVPVLRHTTRSGKLTEGGVSKVPWTYLEVVAPDAESTAPAGDKTAKPQAAGDVVRSSNPAATTVARIHSGTRRPISSRRQGRVEQIAVLLRTDPAATTMRLHSRTAADKPLVGYDVYAQNAGTEDIASVTLLGSTDVEGKLQIPLTTTVGPTEPGRRSAEPGANGVTWQSPPVQFVYLKNGSQILARLPIVPGYLAEVTVPLPDDGPRLDAETRLAALREELIDVVARRNILIARARQKIKDKDIAGAQKLLNEINELPGRTQFNLTLNTARRLVKSDDPQIERRITQLFEITQKVLAQYLDTAPVLELNQELQDAQRKGESNTAAKPQAAGAR